MICGFVHGLYSNGNTNRASILKKLELFAYVGFSRLKILFFLFDSVGGNRNLCVSGPCSNANGCGSKGSCGKNKRKIIIPVVASIFSSVGLLTVLIILWKHSKGAGCQQGLCLCVLLFNYDSTNINFRWNDFVRHSVFVVVSKMITLGQNSIL